MNRLVCKPLLRFPATGRRLSTIPEQQKFNFDKHWKEIQRKELKENSVIFYTLGLMYAVPVFSGIGFMSAMKVVLDTKYYDKSIVGSATTLMGGTFIGLLASPIYPIVAVISPFKYLYDAYRINIKT